MKIAFDKDKYLKLQSENILKRIDKFGEKLYIEFGGKLFDDYHASRVLPGFEPDLKTQLLESMKDSVEIIFVINASDIVKNRIRGDYGITYDQTLLRSVDILRERGLNINSVVITKYKGQNSINSFINNLTHHKIKVHKHYYIEHYPYDVDRVLSSEGFGKDDYVVTSKPIVIVASPGAGSGKLRVCLSQMYNDNLRGIKAGYAKFETFPVWNLPLKHPVNLAYESSTADIDDINMIDNYHLEAYGINAVNYNRDIEMFPVLKRILYSIFGQEIYKSPTDIGVNMVGFCITDEEEVTKACKNEIIRRYYTTKVSYKLGLGSDTEHSIEKIRILMDYLNISVSDRRVVGAAFEKQEQSSRPSMAIEMKDSTIIKCKTSELMTAPAAMILDSLKYLAGIDDEIRLIPNSIGEPLLKFKKEVFKTHILTLNEILIALNIMAETDKTASLALSKLPLLWGLDAHSTYILNSLDQKVLKNLGVNYTSEDVFHSNKLYEGY